jgi:hypothetical protein
MCLDFPGTGEDEIGFRRGEIIVVIARDDGYDDGWWTVIFPRAFYFDCITPLCAMNFVSFSQEDFMEAGWAKSGQ